MIEQVDDQTVSFQGGAANAAFFSPQNVVVAPMAQGSCQTFTNGLWGLQAWFMLSTPIASSLRSAGNQVTLANGSTSLALAQSSGQYNAAIQTPLPTGIFQLSWPGGEVPAYDGQGPSLPDSPSEIDPSTGGAPTGLSWTVQPGAPFTLTWTGHPANSAVVELFGHDPNAQPGSTTGVVDIACAVPDQGSFTVLASVTAQMPRGYVGQAQVYRIQPSSLSLSDGEAVLALGISSSYYDAQY